MLRVSHFAGLAALTAIGAVAACNRDRSASATNDPNEQDKAGTTHTTGAPLTTKDTAVDRIVAARCAREVTCSNVGADKPFTSGDKCIAEVKASLDNELGPNECPDGIDGARVDECLDAIRNESCSNPVTTVQRVSQCRTGSLCMKPYGRTLF